MDKPANRFYGEQRVGIEPGEYGRILLEGYRDNRAAIEVPYYMTADDLREAANFFNQLAEYMDSGS